MAELFQERSDDHFAQVNWYCVAELALCIRARAHNDEVIGERHDPQHLWDT
jgi:hypothetical protein